jgi:mRNA-degrading endonuclease RelE of RelBE toxin-antitoxin system
VSSGSKAEYTVEISNPAKKDLKRLSQDVQKRIIPVLRSLATEPRPEGVKKLRGSGAYGFAAETIGLSTMLMMSARK